VYLERRAPRWAFTIDGKVDEAAVLAEATGPVCEKYFGGETSVELECLLAWSAYWAVRQLNGSAERVVDVEAEHD